jgi:hypothetical protein
MILDVVEVYQDIVEIYNNTFIKEAVEHIVHESLECCRGIRDAKRHNVKLVMTVPCSKSGLVPIMSSDHNLIIAAGKVNFRKDGCFV